MGAGGWVGVGVYIVAGRGWVRGCVDAWMWLRGVGVGKRRGSLIAKDKPLLTRIINCCKFITNLK